jgi:hypothetical protein
MRVVASLLTVKVHRGIPLVVRWFRAPAEALAFARAETGLLLTEIDSRYIG